MSLIETVLSQKVPQMCCTFFFFLLSLFTWESWTLCCHGSFLLHNLEVFVAHHRIKLCKALTSFVSFSYAAFVKREYVVVSHQQKLGRLWEMFASVFKASFTSTKKMQACYWSLKKARFIWHQILVFADFSFLWQFTSWLYRLRLFTRHEPLTVNMK